MILSALYQCGMAQNVGIGTTTPAAKLDVKSSSSYVAQFNGTAPMYMGIFENDTYRGYWGSYSGNPEDVDFGTGSGTNGKLHLTIKAQPKLTIDTAGNVGIGTVNPEHTLHVKASDKYGIYSTATIRGGDTIAAVYGLAVSPTPVPFSAGVRGESNSIDYNGIGVLGLQTGSGWGVAGFAKEGGLIDYGSGVYGTAGSPLSGYGIGGYGVYGVNNNQDGTGGYFRDNVNSGNSKALKTSGKIQFSGIGAANGKVLTSDASGFATWQNLPGGASAWVVSGNNIYNSNTGFVGIGTNPPTHTLEVTHTTKGSLFVEPVLIPGTSTVHIRKGYEAGGLDVPCALEVESYGELAASFTGTGGGIEAWSKNSNVRPGGKFAGGDGATGGEGIAIELIGGIAVNGGATNKPVFTHVASAANITGNTTKLDYPNPAATDFVLVTPNWTAGAVYNNHPIGVYFTSGKWAIFNQDLTAMPVGTAFNVMVIRQN